MHSSQGQQPPVTRATGLACRIAVFSAAALVAPLASVPAAWASGGATCGTVLMEDLVLDADLVCPGTGLVVGADNVSIDLAGFHLIGSGAGAGVYADNRRGLTIRNGTIEGFYQGVSLYRQTGSELVELAFSDNFVGFYASRGSANALRNSVVTRSIMGVLGDESERGMLVADTRFTENSTGLVLSWNSGGSHIVRNHFSNNGGAISTTENGGHLIEDNLIAENRVGVSLFSSGGNRVFRNRIADNERFGVAISGSLSNGNQVEDNIVQRNDVGIRVAIGGLRGTEISGNQIRDNRSAGMQMDITSGFADGSAIVGNTFSENGFGSPLGSAGDGLDVYVGAEKGVVTVAGNRAFRNAGLGIRAAGVVDGGANRAKRNGNPLQCIGVVC